MDNKVKTILANFTGKASKKTIKLLKRNGTHTPGVFASKVNSNILKDMNKPNNIIAITGTNGKTTTTNLIADILKNMNIKYVSNLYGSNTKAGIISSLLDANNLVGKIVVDNAILEIDEQWCTHVLKDLNVSSLTITNLFQDSYERNANIFYILKRIKDGLNDNIKLILNADDAISAYVSQNNPCIYFGVANIFNDESSKDEKIKDLIYCPYCENKIIWDFNRYHHIGRYHCANNDFKNPIAKYEVVEYDDENNLLFVREEDEIFKMISIRKNIESIYNQIAAYATLRENGYSRNSILEAMVNLKTVESRYFSEIVGNKELISMVAKGYNPVANSRVLNAISSEDGNKTLIYLFDNLEANCLDTKSTAWAFAIDFKYLKNVDKFIIMSKLSKDLSLAILMDGIDKEKIVVIDKLDEIKNYIDINKEEKIYLLHGIDAGSIKKAKKAFNIIKNCVVNKK